MKRLFISIVVALTIVLGLLPASVFANGTPSGSSTGTFTVGHEPPVINSVKLYDATGTTEVISMNPQTQYMFKVDVTNLNGLDYLTKMEVNVFSYNGTPIWPDPAVLLTQNATAGQKNVVVANAAGFVVGHNVLIKDLAHNEDNVIASIAGNTLTMVNNLANTYTVLDKAAATDFNDIPVGGNSRVLGEFSWNILSNSWTSSYPPAVGDSGATTWSSGIFTTPSPTQLANDNNFVFTGQFTPGKVATAGTWYIRARITDTENGDTRGHTGALTMNTYDEIILTTGSVNWGQLTPGGGFKGYNDSGTPIPVSVRYIANGNYSKYVSSGDWLGSTHTATLDGTGAASAKDYFSLQAVIGANTQYVTSTAPYGTLMDNTGTLTYEYGDRPDASLALKLNSAFDTDSYQGNIVYYIITR
jgi:hypothetical protein